MKSELKEEGCYGRKIKDYFSKISERLYSVELPDNDAVRGMIWHVRHLVKVEEV